MKNTPSFTFIPTPDCENSAYVATEKVAGIGYQLSKFKDPNNLMLGLGYRFHDKR